MFAKYKASERRVVLINFEGVAVYGLRDGALTQLLSYRHEDKNFEDFRSYLASVPRAPVTVMVDSIAEDFIVESVAHTRFTDRRNLLKRKLSQHFRGVEFASAMILAERKMAERMTGFSIVR